MAAKKTISNCLKFEFNMFYTQDVDSWIIRVLSCALILYCNHTISLSHLYHNMVNDP